MFHVSPSTSSSIASLGWHNGIVADLARAYQDHNPSANKAIALTECNGLPLMFSRLQHGNIQAVVNGAAIPSDAGSLRPREVDRRVRPARIRERSSGPGGRTSSGGPALSPGLTVPRSGPQWMFRDERRIGQSGVFRLIPSPHRRSRSFKIGVAWLRQRQ